MQSINGVECQIRSLPVGLIIGFEGQRSIAHSRMAYL
jgi:hypothetical protein